jgi:hypothetical protein
MTRIFIYLVDEQGIRSSLSVERILVVVVMDALNLSMTFPSQEPSPFFFEDKRARSQTEHIILMK